MCDHAQCDGTRLGHELFLMEQANPEIAAARDALYDAIDRVVHPDDYVRPENLQADSEELWRDAAFSGASMTGLA